MDLMFPGASDWSLGTGIRARNSRLPNSGSSHAFSSKAATADFSGAAVLAALPVSFVSQINPRQRQELDSLRGERNRAVFFAALADFTRRLEADDRFAPAAELQALLAAEPGVLPSRLETTLSRFARTAADPRGLLPLVGGSLAFQAAKTFALGRLATGTAWWTRGLGGKIAAASFGMAAEVPTFVLLRRALGAGNGEAAPAWDRELFSAALTLGVLRIAAQGARFGTRLLPAETAAFGTRAPAWLAAQGATLLALVGVRRWEESLGFLPRSDAATAVFDGLAGMLSYGVASHLAGRLVGPASGSWFADLPFRSPQTPFRPRWAFAANGRAGAIASGEPSPQRPSVMFMSSHGENGGKPDPQLVHRVQTQARLRLFEEAAKQKLSRMVPAGASGMVTVDLHFDKATGRLLTPADLQDSPIGMSVKIRIRADFAANVIRIPAAALEGFDYQLSLPNVPAVEKDILRALIDLNGKIIGDLDKLPQIEKKTPRDQPSVSIEAKRGGDKRADQTMPLFTGLNMVAPVKGPADFLQEALARHATSAWAQTNFKDQPPLLSYINPPVLVGYLALDEEGRLLGSGLSRPWFAGYGDTILDPIRHPEGKEVSVLVSPTGDLLSYSPRHSLSPKQAGVINDLGMLPKGVMAAQEMLKEYPYLMDLVNGTRSGIWFLQINDALGTGARPDGQYAQRMYVIRDKKSFLILSPQAFRERDLRRAVAIFDAGYGTYENENRRFGLFRYAVRRGQLPPEMKYVLDLTKWRVEKTPGVPIGGGATSP